MATVLGGKTPITTVTSAGGALTGTYPNPTLNVSGGPCASGQALTNVSSTATLTCTPISSSAWSLTGNSGTTSSNYLGTSDNTNLNIDVNAIPALQIQPNGTSPNLIGGFNGNTVTVGKAGATIAGGGQSGTGSDNSVTDNFGTVGGGYGNTAGGSESVVAGGLNNLASGPFGASVAGGNANQATGSSAVVAGGFSNRAQGANSIASGTSNVVSGNTASAFGSFNTASGNTATASGSGDLASGDTATAVGSGNVASGNIATAFGSGNLANGTIATAFGALNTASGTDSTAFGYQNNNVGSPSSSGQYSTAIGYQNKAPGTTGFAEGGNNNASGQNGVALGNTNTAGGGDSFAAGNHATVRGPTSPQDNNTFVWSDGSGGITSSGPNQFDVRAAGGFTFESNSGSTITGVTLASGSGSWSSLSDRHAKMDIQPVSGTTALERLSRVPIAEWSYKAQSTRIRHIGPMAQDLYAAFHLGEDNRHIDTIDSEGLALLSIQGLNAKLDSEVAALKARLAQDRGTPAGTPGGSTQAGVSLSSAEILAVALAMLMLSSGAGAASALYWTRRQRPVH